MIEHKEGRCHRPGEPKRTITITLDIHDLRKARPIWDAHGKNREILGGKVVAIAGIIPKNFLSSETTDHACGAVMTASAISLFTGYKTPTAGCILRRS